MTMAANGGRRRDRNRNRVSRERTMTCLECKRQFVVPYEVQNARCPDCGAEMRIRPLHVERDR